MLNYRRKILIYTHAMTGGGAERVCAVLASGLASRGDEVILAVDFAASQNLNFIDPTVRIVVLGAGHFMAVVRLAMLLFRERPDVSMSALSISNLKHFFAAMLAGRLSRAVLSYHGYAHSEPQLLSRISYALTPMLTRLTSATVCVSEGLRKSVVSCWGASSKLTERIYNPVITGKNQPPATAAELMQRKPIVLAAGRLVDYKNFAMLIRAFAQVETVDAKLVILGQGPEFAALQAEIDRLGLNGRAELAGYADEPWQYYEQARCFALSSNSESFGLVVVEAMAAGLAIVTTACDGPSEILENGRYGQIVPVGDENAMAKAIACALADPGEPLPRVKHAGTFSLDRGIDLYTDLFDRVIARARPDRSREQNTSDRKSEARA